VNYGYGYGGSGFQGGYGRAATLLQPLGGEFGTTNITNVYNKTVVNNITVNRVSYNGECGQPTDAVELAARTTAPRPDSGAAAARADPRSNPALRASANHGNSSDRGDGETGVFSGAGSLQRRRCQGERASSAKPRRSNTKPRPQNQGRAGRTQAAPVEPGRAGRTQSAP